VSVLVKTGAAQTVSDADFTTAPPNGTYTSCPGDTVATVVWLRSAGSRAAVPLDAPGAWVAMSGVTGNFSAAAGFATPSYRVNADGSVEFKGAVTAAATASGSVLQAGLPAPGATRNLHGYIADYPASATSTPAET
jgi:hypothetical protein